MYQAKLHPEQYSDTFSEDQMKRLYDSLHYVCGLAVETLSDSSKFPEDWLFKHRWGKGKKDAKMALPNGERITFLTVGGRTSCIVPSVQKKTGKVAGDIKKEELNDEVLSDTTMKSKKRKDIKEEEFDAEADGIRPVGTKAREKKAKANKSPDIVPGDKVNGKKGGQKTSVKSEIEEVPNEDVGRRRSGRISSRVK